MYIHKKSHKKICHTIFCHHPNYNVLLIRALFMLLLSICACKVWIVFTACATVVTIITCYVLNCGNLVLNGMC